MMLFVVSTPQKVASCRPPSLLTRVASGSGPAATASTGVATPLATATPAAAPPVAAPGAAPPPVTAAGTAPPPVTATGAAPAPSAGAARVQGDPQVASVVGASVQRVHRVLRVALVIVPDKGKAATAAGPALQREVDVADVAKLLKQRGHVLRSSTEGEVAHSQRGHPIDVTWRPPECHSCPLL